MNYSPSKAPDTTGGGITTQTQSMGSCNDGQIPIYKL